MEVGNKWLNILPKILVSEGETTTSSGARVSLSSCCPAAMSTGTVVLFQINFVF